MPERAEVAATRVLTLLVDVAEHAQTAEEAEAELRADGVDVGAFLARVNQAVQHQKEADE